MAGLATKDARSALSCNLAYVSGLSGLECKVESAAAVRSLNVKTGASACWTLCLEQEPTWKDSKVTAKE